MYPGALRATCSSCTPCRRSAGENAMDEAAERAYSQPAEAVARRIEQIVLGGQRRYNRVQVSEATGVDRERASRLWLAMGFAEVGDDELVFTDSDIEALRIWDGLVDRK